jgi:hypothetical protein
MGLLTELMTIKNRNSIVFNKKNDKLRFFMCKIKKKAQAIKNLLFLYATV